MGEHGATLQTYNQELVKCIEGLKVKLNNINSSLAKDVEEKRKLEAELTAVTEKLHAVNAKIDRKDDLKRNIEETLNKAENAYIKILESSEVLLSMVKRETEYLDET